MHFGHTAISHLILNSEFYCSCTGNATRRRQRLRQRRRVFFFFGQSMRCQLHAGHKGHSAERKGDRDRWREKGFMRLWRFNFNSISIVLNSFSNTHWTPLLGTVWHAALCVARELRVTILRKLRGKWRTDDDSALRSQPHATSFALQLAPSNRNQRQQQQQQRSPGSTHAHTHAHTKCSVGMRAFVGGCMDASAASRTSCRSMRVPSASAGVRTTCSLAREGECTVYRMGEVCWWTCLVLSVRNIFKLHS